jgi:hypothetical protein
VEVEKEVEEVEEEVEEKEVEEEVEVEEEEVEEVEEEVDFFVTGRLVCDWGVFSVLIGAFHSKRRHCNSYSWN